MSTLCTVFQDFAERILGEPRHVISNNVSLYAFLKLNCQITIKLVSCSLNSMQNKGTQS